ncbi:MULTISPECIES: hypothetical protein [unclassified Roseitalea]|uniref:hypothetical protein n=1 Tax=unclassified Roseitalea TaxID=2639107 RepID=UPI00273D925B|nr:MULTISPECIES: hypothetical protein [unclassified Roseitalea]
MKPVPLALVAGYLLLAMLVIALVPFGNSGADASVGNEPATVPLATVERYGEDFVAYAIVRRTDGSFRRMLIAPEVLAAVQADAPLPEGTRILMETYHRPDRVGTVFHKLKAGGRWQYGSLSGTGRIDLATGPKASCLSCHARAAETDLTFTLPAIRAAAAGHGLSDFECGRGGRSPCALDVYRDGAAW